MPRPNFVRSLASLSALVVASHSDAQELEAEKLACADAHAEAQQLRSAKKLVEARRALVTCASDRCPTLVKSDCATLLEAVSLELPTFSISVRSSSGDAVTDARIEVDGQVWADLGVAHEVNPGLVRVVVTHPSHAPIVKQIAVVEGKKAQALELTLGAPTSVELPQRDSSLLPPVGAFVFFGLSLGGVAAGAVVGAISLEREQDVRTQDDLDALKRLRLGADSAFIAGGVFAAVGLVWWIVDAASPSANTARLSPRWNGVALEF